jgi:hypothetical protein
MKLFSSVFRSSVLARDFRNSRNFGKISEILGIFKNFAVNKSNINTSDYKNF